MCWNELQEPVDFFDFCLKCSLLPAGLALPGNRPQSELHTEQQCLGNMQVNCGEVLVLVCDRCAMSEPGQNVQNGALSGTVATIWTRQTKATQQCFCRQVWVQSDNRRTLFLNIWLDTLEVHTIIMIDQSIDATFMMSRFLITKN